MTSCNYDRIADRYEELRGGTARADAIAATLHTLIQGRRVLDIGVGTGIIGAAVARHGFTVLGVDISTSMLEKAQVRLPGRITCATGEQLPVRDRSVDTALFVWSLHLIGDRIAALRKAARAVSAQGCVIVVSARSGPQPDEIGQWFTQLNVLRPSDDEPLSDVVAQAALQVVGEGSIALEFTQSPNEQAQLVEDRRYSPLWDLDDSRWRAVVEPVIDGLRSLPEPDRGRDRVLRQPYYVLTSA